jgi:hypothetical protein
MKRFPGTPALLITLLAAASAARADQNGGPRPGGGGGLRGMERCLSTLDLPAAQQANVEASLNNGRATLKADGEALKAAHTQMQADLANSADKSVIGQDAINLDAAKAKMKTDAQAVHDDVLAKLSTDQQDAFNACASSHSGYHRGQAPTSPQQ